MKNRLSISIASLGIISLAVGSLLIFYLSNGIAVTKTKKEEFNLNSGEISIKLSEGILSISNGSVEAEYNRSNGLYNLSWDGDRGISGAYATVKTADGSVLRSSDYKTHDFSSENVMQLNDGFGKGVKVSIVNRADNKPDIIQNFYIYEDLPYLMLDQVVSALEPISTDDISPLTVASGNSGENPVVNIGRADGIRMLMVPFDNDSWVRYESNPVKSAKESYEVTSVYDPASRKGLVIGSVTHDTWKTGITAKGTEDGHFLDFRVYGGAAGELTRDSLPHGSVAGLKVTSPKIFVGYYEDYRDGLEAYGKANAVVAPPMKWEEGVPFGWNSWAALSNTVSYDSYVNTSDFIKQNIQINSFNNDGIVYINFDSFWDNLSEDQLVEAVKHIHANGQKAGIYWSPSAYWGGDPDRAVEGSDYAHTFNEILLKDGKGKLLPPVDGALAIDPTNPVELARIDWQFDRFIKWGFDFVKLDFMGHGALEGVHYNKEITTGIQAYNYGMKHIAEILDQARVGRPFFISLSIAPLFPGQYAHSRRISCDAFGSISDTEYMLNSLTYGWWINDTVYRYNDPDHVVLDKSFDKPPVSENEAMSRFNASVIAGTVLLDSDDFSRETARERAAKLLTNPEVNALARKGASLRPVEGDTIDGASNSFVLEDKGEGVLYLAVFNYSSSQKTFIGLDFSRLGLKPATDYDVYDLWSKTDFTARDIMNVELEPAESKIFKLKLID